MPEMAAMSRMSRGSEAGPGASVACGSPGYSVRLLRLAQPPARLYYAGALPGEQRAIAIVGSRAASGAGCGRASGLAADLGRRGFAIISGGAFGIDAAAHEGALAAGAPTFAVLGCGVDVVYPDRHEDLYRRIAVTGGLLSEYPSGTAPRPGQFPARNRIIAALVQAVVVVEAAPRSGALITARLAHELGVPVLVVPGSAGGDRWLARGDGVPCDGAHDIEDALAGRPARARSTAAPAVPPALAPLLAALAQRPDGAAGLAARLGLPLPVVMSRLTEAELDGRVHRILGGHYEVNRAH
jgi:DNA processing protein